MSAGVSFDEFPLQGTKILDWILEQADVTEKVVAEDSTQRQEVTKVTAELDN